jgi:hypothetical protein
VLKCALAETEFRLKDLKVAEDEKKVPLNAQLTEAAGGTQDY